MLPAAFCTAWQDAQKDSPYKVAPAAGSAEVLAETVAVSPRRGVLFAMRNAETSRASSSLSLKFGIVDVGAYICGSFSQANIHSRVVLSAMCERGGGSSVAFIVVPSGSLTAWQ